MNWLMRLFCRHNYELIGAFNLLDKALAVIKEAEHERSTDRRAS